MHERPSGLALGKKINKYKSIHPSFNWKVIPLAFNGDSSYILNFWTSRRQGWASLFEWVMKLFASATLQTAHLQLLFLFVFQKACQGQLLRANKVRRWKGMRCCKQVSIINRVFSVCVLCALQQSSGLSCTLERLPSLAFTFLQCSGSYVVTLLVCWDIQMLNVLLILIILTLEDGKFWFK